MDPDKRYRSKPVHVLAVRRRDDERWTYVHRDCSEGVAQHFEQSREAYIYVHPELLCPVCNDFLGEGPEFGPIIFDCARLNEYGEPEPLR